MNVRGVVLTFVLALGGAAAAQAQTSADGDFTWSPRAYVQFDTRAYPGWEVSTGTGRLEYDTLEVRRLRAGVEGKWKQFDFELGIDPLDNLDGAFVKDAYLQWRASKPLRIRLGQFKLPGGHEYDTSAANIDFLERSGYVSSSGATRDMGVMASGRIRKGLEYQAGLFAGDGHGRKSRAGITAAGRLEWQPSKALTLGTSMSGGRTHADDSEPANGVDGRTSSGYRFFERVYVNGWRTRLGADASWTPGPWAINAEVLRVTDQRQGQGLDFEDLPSVVSNGWSASVIREFGRRRGAARSRLHEFTVGLRAEGQYLDDTGTATSASSVRPRATDIRPRGATTIGANVSWNLAKWARIMTGTGWDWFTDTRSAPDASRRGYWSFGTRLQLDLK